MDTDFIAASQTGKPQIAQISADFIAVIAGIAFSPRITQMNTDTSHHRTIARRI